MEQDSSPVVPVSLEFNGVRVTLSLPEPKRARTTITPTKDLTEAPPIPAVPAFHPGTKTTTATTKFKPFEFTYVDYGKSALVERVCDSLMRRVEFSVPHGKPGYAMAVLKQVYEMISAFQNGEDDIEPELTIAIDHLQDYYDSNPALQHRIDELDCIHPNTFDRFIELLIEIFTNFDNKRPSSVTRDVRTTLIDLGYRYRGIKHLTLKDMFIE